MNRDEFVVEEPSGPRWDAAIEFLREGRHVSCMGLALTLATEAPLDPRKVGDVLKVRVQTRHNPTKLTREQAAAELANAAAGVAEIVDRSPEFAQLVFGRHRLYELIDDYGMGSVLLATMNERGLQFDGIGGAS